jgi:dUTP pyrophosphatase
LVLFLVVAVKVRKLGEGAKLPTYSHEGDAGMDFYSAEDVVLKPGERHAFSTQVAVEIPHGCAGLFWDKSGLARNSGIKSMGGVIDSGYRGEIVITLVNLGQEAYHFKKGDRIAQMLIQPVEHAKIEESPELSETGRGTGGFGSTGK